MQHGTAQEHVDNGIGVDLESARAWAQKAAKEGWFAEIGVTAATLAVFGWIIFAIHKAMQGYEMGGQTFF